MFTTKLGFWNHEAIPIQGSCLVAQYVTASQNIHPNILYNDLLLTY